MESIEPAEIDADHGSLRVAESGRRAVHRDLVDHRFHGAALAGVALHGEHRPSIGVVSGEPDVAPAGDLDDHGPASTLVVEAQRLRRPGVEEARRGIEAPAVVVAAERGGEAGRVDPLGVERPVDRLSLGSRAELGAMEQGEMDAGYRRGR